MKTTLDSERLMLGLLLLPFAYLAVIWPQLPAVLPGHYGPNGQPDRYDPKEMLVLLLAGVTVLLYVTFRFLPLIAPRAGLDTGLYEQIRWWVMGFWMVFLVWFWTISWRGIGPETLMNSVGVGVGLLLAGLGNLLNSLKPNYFVGIRTPWTLESPVVWQRTHRLVARLFVIGGLGMAVLVGLVPSPVKLPLVLGLAVGLSVVAVGYSYVCFRQEKARA